MKAGAFSVVFLALLAWNGCSSQRPIPHGSPVGPFILTAGQTSDAVFSFKGDNGGALSPVSSLPVGHSPSALLIQSPQTLQQNVFVADAGSNNLAVLNLDPMSGMLSSTGISVATGANPIAITIFGGPPNPTVQPEFGFIYVLNQGSNNISAFHIVDQVGHLSPVPGSPFPTQANPQAFAVASTGSDPTSMASFLYVANGAQGTISAFHLNNDGTLTEIAGSPFAAGGNISWVAAQPFSGPLLYASDTMNNNVLGFKVQSTGALTPVSGAPFTVGSQPGFIRIGINNFLYVANRAGNSVSGFKMDPVSGVLTPISGSPFTTGTNPSSLAMARGQLYVANHGSSNISAFAVDFNSGALTPVSGSPFAVSTSPDWVEDLFIMNVD